MSPARLTVRAVVVSDARAPQLPAVLDAVLTQDPAPDDIHLLLTADVAQPDAGWPERVDVRRVEADGYAAAMETLLSDAPAGPEELVWLLHDDTAPMPGALAALTATARKRRRAGVIGAAQVRWDDPSRLVSLGTTTTRIGARRIALVEHEDVDQGQYADRDDVLAVSLGGALVRREAWDRLDGLDPGCRGWSESVDLCRRAWRAGYDVVAVPAARVRHSQESLHGRRDGSDGGRRATYTRRRASEWYHSLAYAPLLAIPLLLLWSLLSAVARGVLRIAQNEPRMLLADLVVPWRLLVLLPGLPRSRGRVRRAGRTGLAAERRLLARPRQVARHVRALEWGTRSRRAVAQAPSDVVRAELAVARGRRRATLATLAAVLAGVSVALHPGWLAAIARGDMLAGPVLGVTDAGIGDLWTRATTGWTSQALGAPAVDAGHAILLVPFAAVPGGLAVGLGLLLLLAPLLAGIAAWAAAGAFTRSLVVRALAALAYALWPSALASSADGRVGAVLAHLALPWAVLGLARAGGWQRGERIGDGDEHPATPSASPSAAMGAAAALAIAVFASPVLLAPVLVIVALLGAFAGRRRWRVWSAAVAPIVVSVPGLVAAWSAGLGSTSSLAILAREPGPSATAPALSALDLLTGDGHALAGLPLSLDLAPRALAATVVVVALVAALLGRRRGLTALSMLAAAAGLGLAVLVQTVTVSPDAGAGAARAAGWYGPGMSMVAIALLVVVCAATADAWFAGAGAARAWRRAGGALAVAVAAVATAAAAVAQAWPGAMSGGVEASSRDVLPLVAALEQGTDARQRVLTLDGERNDVAFAVLADDGTTVVSSAATLDLDDVPAVRPGAAAVPGAADLGEDVAGLLAGRPGAAAELGEWGIGVVVAAPGADSVADALSQGEGLSLMGASDRGTSWRIGAAEGEGRVSLAWWESADGSREPLPMGRAAGGGRVGGAGTVTLAVAADPAWVATLDGAVLEPAADARGRQAFAVTGQGMVEVRYDDRAYRAWFWAGLAVVAWSAIAAIPVRSRRARREQDA